MNVTFARIIFQSELLIVVSMASTIPRHLAQNRQRRWRKKLDYGTLLIFSHMLQREAFNDCDYIKNNLTKGKNCCLIS